ncbi:MAG: hypothetical protein IV100_19750 [Myxococcales bacterium]|nr:hypothetical protein [Myxococcales bacterium]
MTASDARTRIAALVLGVILGSEVASSSRIEAVTPAAGDETLDSAIRRNVATILNERRGIRVLDPEADVRWLTAPEGEMGALGTTTHHVFAVLGTVGRESCNRDLYRLEARVTPYGVVFDDGWIVNLSHTADADEGNLVARGLSVATTVSWGGRVLAVEVRDLAGENRERTGAATWGLLRGIGESITNLEQTGSVRGLELQRFTVEADSPPERVHLTFGPAGRLHVDQSGAEGPTSLAVIDLDTDTSVGPLALAYAPPEEKMQYDFLNWLADRGRGFADQGLTPEWTGAGVELMKEVYFKAEEVKAKVEEVVSAPEPSEAPAEAVEVVERAVEKARLESETSGRPWPPPPIEPMIGERQKGEGLWEVIPDTQVTWTPGAPPPFYKTFVRPDAEFPSKKVWISVWDSEHISLKMRAGTTNPVPTTGNRGDGRIPRDPDTLRRVVGGFNGGFQTAHVWYGMMVDRKVLLPPREYGATAGSWEDGRTAFATWPEGAPIPEGLTHYRQNLPPLLEDGKFNPYGRNTWGWHKNVAGAVEGKTIRSALCYSKLNHVMYFYAEFCDEHTLTNTLLAAGCTFAIHLDMNRGHTGFEMYRVLGDGESGAAGASMTVEGVRFEGHNLHPTNQHMKAPTRYLGVDYRDFFYLERRPTLTEVALGDGLVWSGDSLPANADFPPRFARAATPSGEAEYWAVDPRAVAFKDASSGDSANFAGLALAFELPPPSGAAASSSVRLGMAPPPPPPRVTPVAAAAAAPESGIVTFDGTPLTGDEGRITGLVAASDRRGFVILARLEGADAAAVRAAFTARGAENPVYRAASARPGLRLYQTRGAKLVEAELGGTEGTVVDRPSLGAALTLHAIERPPGIVRLFPDMKPKPKTNRR